MEKLDLSSEQQEQIKAIKQETREQLRALRQEKNEANREQAKAIVQQSRKAVEAVLTPEQQAKLAQLKADKKAAWEAVDKEALKAELKAYREEKIEPVLRASRGKLDAFIAQEDQAEIERLRGVFATRPDKGMKGMRGEKRGSRDDQAAKQSARREAGKAWRTEHAEDLESLRALTEKYKVELQRVQDVLESSRETWRQDMSAIKAKYLPEGMEGRGRKARKASAGRKDKAERQGKKGRRSRGGERMKAGAFLLMKA